MNKASILILIISFLLNASAQCQVKTVYLSSFGALANDELSDQKAFNAAADYINKRGGNTRLIIAAGKYLVGNAYVQKNSKETITTGTLLNVMQLVDCKNVTIQGTGNVEIKFADNIPFGTLPNRLSGKDSAVHIGSLFRLYFCDNVVITNIKANGNNEKFYLLKQWGIGTNPYEREHEGLFLVNSRNVTVSNCSFNSFGRDGVLLLADIDKQPVKNISFNNCTFNNNGRNGVSWTAGENVSFRNCKFNNNASGKIRTNPGSGLDIEPERNALCTKGTITKCEFTGNGGYGMTSGYAIAKDVIFDSCTIVGTSTYALICVSPSFTFKNSTIAGTALFYYDAATAADGIKSINCIFTDSLQGKVVTPVNFLIGITGRFVKFDKCVFNSYKIPAIYTEIKKKAQPDNDENTLFRNCTFSAYFTRPSTWQNNAFLISNSTLIGCTFKTKGYADFKYILNEGSKNNRQDKNSFIKIQ